MFRLIVNENSLRIDRTREWWIGRSAGDAINAASPPL
jgi:hypothetical protein